MMVRLTSLKLFFFFFHRNANRGPSIFSGALPVHYASCVHRGVGAVDPVVRSTTADRHGVTAGPINKGSERARRVFQKRAVRLRKETHVPAPRSPCNTCLWFLFRVHLVRSFTLNPALRRRASIQGEFDFSSVGVYGFGFEGFVSTAIQQLAGWCWRVVFFCRCWFVEWSVSSPINRVTF